MTTIESSDDLKNWLNARPEETRYTDGIAIALRAVNRVLPLFCEQNPTIVVLPLFRFLTSIKLACYCQKHPVDLAVAPIANIVSYSVVNGSYAITDAASAVSFVADAVDDGAVYDAIKLAALAVRFAIDAVHVATHGSGATFAASAAYAFTAYDISKLEDGKSNRSLLATSLWPGERPAWVSLAWQEMQTGLLSNGDEHWEVWIKRYERTLKGYKPTQIDLEIENEFLSLPESDWEQGPAHINSKILQIEAKWEAKREQQPFVFLSYKSEDRPHVTQVRNRLQAQSISCWWDQDIGNSEVWSAEIQKHLKSSSLIATFWTKNSIDAPTVTEEARLGISNKKLVQFLYDNVEPTYGFSEYQWDTADFNQPKEVVDIIARAFRRRVNTDLLKEKTIYGVSYDLQDDDKFHSHHVEAIAPDSIAQALTRVKLASAGAQKSNMGRLDHQIFTILDNDLDALDGQYHPMHDELIFCRDEIDTMIEQEEDCDSIANRRLRDAIDRAAKTIRAQIDEVKMEYARKADLELAESTAEEQKHAKEAFDQLISISDTETSETLSELKERFFDRKPDETALDKQRSQKAGYRLADAAAKMSDELQKEAPSNSDRAKKVFGTAESAGKALTAIDKGIDVILKWWPF